ncbi:1-pyrroline-5-carboxylate dehydrogenase [Tieghemiomyces parasiticus]|uniref:Multifunctional fusion protein n=1 Tax=Tieghemiomyces parasiticus TaxID=78921 RepID=A0A9W8ADQ4_9FUNG|nr:1-pyrroline-5-carboxylate dehydrogenase [Tieghemiomyces parasiticus]
MSAVPQTFTVKLPAIRNEPMYSYAPGSVERRKLAEAIKEIRDHGPYEVPVVIDGKPVKTGQLEEQRNPSDHQHVVCRYHNATDPALVTQAVEGALRAKESWETLPLYDRLAVMMRAADLLATKYRYKLMAATMLGQGKNVWQAEIDAAAEAVDFLRFNCKFAEEIYAHQPPENSAGSWNHVEYRPLEGFVFAVSPFNFTAIAANLCGAPAVMGNVVVWKPSPSAILSNYFMYQVFEEAGLPAGVIQFVPGPAAEMAQQLFARPDFAGLHFTGSTVVFKGMWKTIAQHIDTYHAYPRIVGETGGKNFHLIHSTAPVRSTAIQTIRAAFEYQGQKCSACSRCYAPKSKWPEFKEHLLTEHGRITVGPVDDFSHFMTAVINRPSFDKITKFIDHARAADDCEIIAGGTYDDSKGYFIQPTIIVTTNPQTKTMTDEIFGPVLTILVYDDNDGATESWRKAIDLINTTGTYGLTGAIFATDRLAIVDATSRLRHTAGNFYINDKCTGAVVGQQSFGGARNSGTNDKAGSANLLYRFVSPRSVKETFVPVEDLFYPHNVKD